MGTIARGTGMKKILAAALMLGAVEFPSAALAQQATINQTITGTRLDISATGDVTRVPDLATISAGVVSRAATATAAMQQTASRMARVREALRKAGIADRDIQTSNVSLNPDYVYAQNQPPKLSGYDASNQVTVRFHVAVAPGVGFGEEGEGFVRLALVENEQRLRQAAKGVKKMLGGR